MPTRMIREGLLDSERYWSVTIEAQRMFFHMLLLADDFGCVSVSPTFLRRRCFNDSPSIERISKLLNELIDVDLIRTYEVDRACLAFIPRFGQRLQRDTLKHPAPPEMLYQDDVAAAEKFRKIRDKTEIPTVLALLPTVGQPPKRREEKKTRVAALPDWLPRDAWDSYLEMRKKIRKPATDKAIALALAELEKLRQAGHDPRAVLENSILNSWQGLFAPKVVQSKGGVVL